WKKLNHGQSNRKKRNSCWNFKKERKKKATKEKHKTNTKNRRKGHCKSKEKNEKILKRVYANETSEAEKENKNEELDTTKQKLKRYYQSQDKFDPEQSIDTCYIRLALLTQQQFQQQKDKMIKKKEKIKKIKEKMETGQIH
ncbi:hypothetical protein RFI_29433, partial [Reticulomyxa filosa]